MAKILFDSKFLHQLNSLKLVSKRARKVFFQGDRRGGKPGSGLEFIDYREYQVGDDYRYIDWHLFSRLEQLFVKLFTQEENLRVHLIIDESESMSGGDPSKIDYACQLAAVLGYIALVNLDEVGSSTFSFQLGKTLPSRRGRSQVFNLFHFLEGINTQGKTSFSSCLKEFSRRQRKAGMAVVLSDLLDPQGYEKGLLSLRSRGWEVCLLHILEQNELRPIEKGEVVLIDKETHQRIETIIDEVTCQRYEQELRDFFQRVESFCQHYEINYVRVLTSLPLTSFIFQDLRKRQILK